MNSLLKSTADRSSASPHLLDRAFSLFSSGRPREALAIVTEVLKRAPKNPQTLNLAGICSHSLGQLNDAENYWRRALTRNPDDVAEGWPLYEARYDEKNRSTGIRNACFWLSAVARRITARKIHRYSLRARFWRLDPVCTLAPRTATIEIARCRASRHWHHCGLCPTLLS